MLLPSQHNAKFEIATRNQERGYYTATVSLQTIIVYVLN